MPIPRRANEAGSGTISAFAPPKAPLPVLPVTVTVLIPTGGGADAKLEAEGQSRYPRCGPARRIEGDRDLVGWADGVSDSREAAGCPWHLRDRARDRASTQVEHYFQVVGRAADSEKAPHDHRSWSRTSEPRPQQDARAHVQDHH